MKVFKFGGASVKDAAAVRNVGAIMQVQSVPANFILVVVSAMGKTTNALEQVFDKAFYQQDYQPALSQVQEYHNQIIKELFAEQHPVYEQVEELFQLLTEYLQTINPAALYDLQYDQVVSYGELLASIILKNYLQAVNLPSTWLDCRQVIRTDRIWREARLDWPETETKIKAVVKPLLETTHVITQGFLGGTDEGLTTTLGREGSDYSAAIFAHCLPAESVTIWKDVAGLLNADPKLFPDPILYPEISYQETVEMAYYGASVIHPKTIKPLANSHIPLYVKSFLNPEASGTIIHDCQHENITPAFIVKPHQCLISFQEKDYAFINESNLSTIFAALAQYRFKINLMQNSAISFSICTDYEANRLEMFRQSLQDQFNIHYNTRLTLFTIKNYDEPSVARLTQNQTILLEQRSRTTFQFVSKE
ncbi:aspartate kinase [Adhaeribacter pallidiroseus]|uniref:Aspartokinase n=1 Tax=Adhaeribacter pallidiroseus TaxID=2072847 RepID=A0A369QGX2_9BACT|nr:aspartate kinase [Adhaeribacter pallidiroseus]RDC63520.1 Aspartate kinase [Adhaeribacter pallidiroseus]